MKKHFITYGSNAFVEAAQHITIEAEKTALFQAFKVYSLQDLPLPIKASPLFLSGKGGGHWLWKPYILHHYLKHIPEGEVVVYLDCGSTLYRSRRWQEYFELLRDTHAVFFQYRTEHPYGWNAFDPSLADSPKLKHWIKKSAVEQYAKIFASPEDWLEKNKLWAGFLIVKNSPETRQMIGDWLHAMLYEPHLATDLLLSEREEQTAEFAQSRYDQTILSILARYYEKKGWVTILDEEAEADYPEQAVRASRTRHTLKKNLWTRTMRKLKRR